MSDDGPSAPAPITAASEPLLWPELVAGAVDFDAGAYWEAHEAWETAWKAWDDGDRDYLKGLIQAAAVQYHLRRDRPSAASAVLGRRVFAHLAGNHPERWPLPTAAIVAVLQRQAAALAAGAAVPDWPPGLRLLASLDAAPGHPA